MTRDTINLLVTHLQKIQGLIKEEGFSNLRLLVPNVVDDWVKINLVVDFPEEQTVDVLVISYLIEEVEKLLDCPVMLVTSSMIREQFKKSLLESSLMLDENQKEKIKEFWNQALLPLLEKVMNNKHFSSLLAEEKQSKKK